MNKILFAVLVISNLVALPGLAQDRWQLTAFGGVMNYNGELNSAFRLKNSKPSFGLGVQYKLTDFWAVQANLTYGKLNAHDSNNVANTAHRNLHFSNNIFEVNTVAVLHFRDLYYKMWTPYVFVGVAYFHHEPYTYYADQKVKLRPLSTEGQGLANYPDRKPYSPHQIAIPFGGGVKFRLSDKVHLAYEVNLRKLFTDYIDDVSTRYVNPADLLAERNQLAVDLSYRGGEIPGGNPAYPALNTIRGSEKTKDWYYNHGIKLFIGLGDGGGRNNYLRCPKF
jgi:opacity protein-like surface antigen